MRKGKERTPIEELDAERNLNRIHLHALPDSWEWRTVEDAGINQKNAIVDGPFGSNLKVSDYVEGGPVPVLTTKNLEGNYDDVRYISNDKFEELKRSAVHSGDILMAKIGSCGKTGIYPPEKPPAIIPANLLKITLNERYERKYVFYYLNSEFFQRALRTIIKATAQPAFSVTNFRTLPLPYTEVRMQKRIVAEIEKQFSRLDEAVTNLKRVKANLKRYRASVLKAAVEGRLVETEAEIARREGREYETGKQLLERILETRRREWKGKGQYKEPAAPDISELPELPEGWAWGGLEELLLNLTDGDHRPPPQTQEGVPFLVIGNVRNGEISFDDTRFVSEDYFRTLDPFRRPAKDDLLYTLVGSYGIPVRVKTSRPFCIQRHMAILRPHTASPIDYLTIAMASDMIFRRATTVATGTAQKTVPLAGLRRFAIPRVCRKT